MGTVYDPLLVFSSSGHTVVDMDSTGILTRDGLKRIAAYKAVELVESGMVIGLGTGSTAKHAIDRIAQLIREGNLKNVIGIPTSFDTHNLAESLGIPLSDLDSHPVVDLSIDGADEVDPFLNLIKGRGGSLLREKMVETASRRFVVIVDDSKMVQSLGGTGQALPVEVVPFCWRFTARKLEDMLGCTANLRRKTGDEAFVTDNGNYVVDLYFTEREISDLEATSQAMLRLPGVVEHGMFVGVASTVVVAGKLGVTIINK